MLCHAQKQTSTGRTSGALNCPTLNNARTLVACFPPLWCQFLANNAPVPINFLRNVYAVLSTNTARIAGKASPELRVQLESPVTTNIPDISRNTTRASLYCGVGDRLIICHSQSYFENRSWTAKTRQRHGIKLDERQSSTKESQRCQNTSLSRLRFRKRSRRWVQTWACLSGSLSPANRHLG